MGRQAKQTTITIDGRDHTGDALLETDELLLRVAGEPKRRRCKLALLENVVGEGATLSFTHTGTRVAIQVNDAARWAARIRSPPSLLDKLRLGASSHAHIAGLEDDETFQELLKAGEIVRVPLGPEARVVVVGITTREQLSIVKRARDAVGDALALWSVYPKGQKELSEDHVRRAARAEGMVDVLVVRFSEKRSGLLLVVRKSERATR